MKEVHHEVGGITMIEWDNNEDGPGKRFIEKDHPFYSTILSQAREDEDATIKRL